MNSEYWLEYFSANALDRPEPRWNAGVFLSLETARHLARSLSHFQLGESGEGKFLLAEAQRFYADDPAYCAALNLFIKEEQEHARLLSGLVQRFRGSLVQKHWTQSIFCLLRRALGIDFEIQVLVIAELVGTAYYRLLQRHIADIAMLDVCRLILQDEVQHVAFHAERFSSNQIAWLPIERAVWAAQFQAMLLVVGYVAWVDHHRALLAVGATRSEFFREVRMECVEFLRDRSSERAGAAVLRCQ
jgi:hypothetical protein